MESGGIGEISYEKSGPSSAFGLADGKGSGRGDSPRASKNKDGPFRRVGARGESPYSAKEGKGDFHFCTPLQRACAPALQRRDPLQDQLALPLSFVGGSYIKGMS